MSEISTLQTVILFPFSAALALPLVDLGEGKYCGKESTLVTVLNRTTAILGFIPVAMVVVVEAVLKFALALFACVLVLPFEMGFTNSSFASLTAVQLFHGGVLGSIALMCIFEVIARCFVPGDIKLGSSGKIFNSYLDKREQELKQVSDTNSWERYMH